MFNNLLHRLNNKYFITLMIFLVWMLIFDNNNFIAQFRLNRTLHELEDEKEYYITEIEKDRQATFELITDTLTLEKFGREQYLMKRDNEDIYLIVDGED
ncbi:MAG: septum formation initiator family protein [Bacteroidota bacterium]